MGKKGTVVWTPQQLAEYEKRTGKVSVDFPAPAPLVEKIKQKRRRRMNQTESRFADVLAAMSRKEEIVSFEFEGITLRYGRSEQFQYTPDFFVVDDVTHEVARSAWPYVRVRMIEVKGAHIRKADWDRFKHARDNFPLYCFELWQWKEKTWTRLA